MTPNSAVGPGPGLGSAAAAASAAAANSSSSGGGGGSSGSSGGGGGGGGAAALVHTHRKKDETKALQFSGPVKVIKTDMSDELQTNVINIVRNAIDKCLSKNKLDKDMAVEIKKELDKKFPHAWHVIIGKHFAVSITHTAKCLLFFTMGSYNILCFRGD